MKICGLLFIGFLLFHPVLFSQEDGKTYDTLHPVTIDTVPIGDLNNDKISDTAFIFTPRTVDTYNEQGEIIFTFGCENDTCYNSIRFSNGFPDLWVGNSVWGEIENAGDLNGDGISEILFCKGWFTSAWTSLSLYTINNGKWEQLAGASIRRADELLRDRLINRKGKWYLIGDQFKDDDFVTYKVSVPRF